MELKLYNTLTRTKEPFRPIDPARVGMYVCGPTVYDFAHIGNARPVIVFDVLFRLLRHLYGADHVKYVRNITDVDDKINARAAERGIPIRELTEETYANFKQDVAALGCLPPTVEPRATEHIEEMKDLIGRLVRNQHAYIEKDHVLFNVASMPDYGQLSNRTLDEMIAGARVEIAPYKRNPMDFVLWKPSDEKQANYELPKWRSPVDIVVPGRPGWHIECSAMSWKHLGETFDIHGGGIDLVFPHHENELAQTRCAFHSKSMANVWMHNGFLQVEGDKMSKSLGNFITIRQLLHRTHGDVIRLNMLKTHYRQPTDWTERDLLVLRGEMMKWSQFLSRAKHKYPKNFAYDRHDSQFMEFLCDDLNVPGSFAVLRDLFKIADENEDALLRFASSLKFLGLRHVEKEMAYVSAVAGYGGIPQEIMQLGWLYRILTLNGLDIEAKQIEDQIKSTPYSFVVSSEGALDFVGKAANDARQKIIELVEARNAARKAKNFAESDRIRDELAQMGVVLKDNKDGTTTWEVAR